MDAINGNTRWSDQDAEGWYLMAYKFRRGDVVHITANMPSSMSHFRAGFDAVILECKDSSYGVMALDDGNSIWWYDEDQFTLLTAASSATPDATESGELLITKLCDKRDARIKTESNLDWIIKNWSTIRKNPSGATSEALMKMIGIRNPWGRNGEGFVWYENARLAIEIMDQVLAGGDKDRIEATANKAREILERR